jgi:hypothetical protein
MATVVAEAADFAADVAVEAVGEIAADAATEGAAAAAAGLGRLINATGAWWRETKATIREQRLLEPFLFVYGSAGVAVLCALGAVAGVMLGHSRHGRLNLRLVTTAPWVAAILGFVIDAARFAFFVDDAVALISSGRAWGPFQCYALPALAVAVCFALSFRCDATMAAAAEGGRPSAPAKRHRKQK